MNYAYQEPSSQTSSAYPFSSISIDSNSSPSFSSSTSPFMDTRSTPSGVSVITGASNIEDSITVPFYPEICYITNSNGDILQLEDVSWNSFIQNNINPNDFNDNARYTFPQIMGKNLFEFISDPKLQRFYRHIMHMVSKGLQPRFTYHWFCDGPDVERKMSMSVCRIISITGEKCILWSSKVIFEKKLKVQAEYLAQPSCKESTQGNRPVCSYCKRILVYLNELSPSLAIRFSNLYVNDERPLFESNGLVPIFGLRGKRGYQITNPFSITSTMKELQSSSLHLWLTPAQFYGEAGLSSFNMTLFHGVCEVCYQECISFFMPNFTTQDSS